MKIFFFSVLIIRFGLIDAQTTRPLTELVNTKSPTWTNLLSMIDTAKNPVEILPVDSIRADTVLLQTQVTTNSPMGAIIYYSGGLLVDSGYIRILGSGSPRMQRSIMDWNKGKSFAEFGQVPAYLLIADDAVGGYFAVNGGAFSTDKETLGKVYYFSPVGLNWIPLEITYTDFIEWCFFSDHSTLYENLRWTNWMHDCAGLSGDQVFYFYPYLSTKEGSNINAISRSAVPVQELWTFTFGK